MREPRERLRGVAMWALLLSVLVVWALLVWHPWIDWFGRPK